MFSPKVIILKPTTSITNSAGCLTVFVSSLDLPSELQNTDLSTCSAQRLLRLCPPNMWVTLVFFHHLLYRDCLHCHPVTQPNTWQFSLTGPPLFTSCLIHHQVLLTLPPKSLSKQPLTLHILHYYPNPNQGISCMDYNRLFPQQMHSSHPVSLPLHIHSADKMILCRHFILLPLLEMPQRLSTTFSTKTNILFSKPTKLSTIW